MAPTDGALPPPERPQSGDVDVFGLTHPGRVRKVNQDQFLIATLHKLLQVRQSSLPGEELPDVVSKSRGWLFLVADGVGGHAEGERASETAVRTVAQYVTNFTDLYRRYDPHYEERFVEELTRSVQHSHDVLRQRGDHEYEGRGHATTLTMVATIWPRAFLVQVGDSRCYRLRDGQLERMSKDQTMAQALIDAGALTADQAELSPLRHVLVSALGGKEAHLMTASADMQWDDVMLLCSDGLTKHVADEEIGTALRAVESAEATARSLVDLALARGGTDNVTVVVGRLRPRRPSTETAGTAPSRSA